MSEPKRYELHTQDLLAIPEDRFDDFIVDLKKWHRAMRSVYKMIETLADATNEKLPPQIAHMVWIDDGKHEGKIIIKQAKQPNPVKEKQE